MPGAVDVVGLDLMYGLHIIKKVSDGWVDRGKSGRELHHAQFGVDVCFALYGSEGVPIITNIRLMYY